jgi:SAM-dependent methyltransferase
MRDYRYIDAYLDELQNDIYAQPVDQQHKNQTKEIFYKWIAHYAQIRHIKNALDVGCGQGTAFEFFKEFNIEYTGITLGEDYIYCKNTLQENVKDWDMHILNFPDASFDLIFARHVLEHSPMPLLALMEWYRVSRQYLIVVTPHCDNVIQGGKNHYYMLNPIQWKVLFERSKWQVIKEDYTDPSEFRFMLTKL